MTIRGFAALCGQPLLILILLTGSPSFADGKRGSAIDYLASKPASMLDLGVIRGQLRIDQMHDQMTALASGWTKGKANSVQAHIYAGQSDSGTVLSMSAMLNVDSVVSDQTCKMLISSLYEMMLYEWEEWFLSLGTPYATRDWRKEWLDFERELFEGVRFSCRCFVSKKSERLRFAQENHEKQCSVRQARLDDIYRWQEWPAGGAPGRRPGELWDVEK